MSSPVLGRGLAATRGNLRQHAKALLAHLANEKSVNLFGHGSFATSDLATKGSRGPSVDLRFLPVNPRLHFAALARLRGYQIKPASFPGSGKVNHMLCGCQKNANLLTCFSLTLSLEKG